MRIRSWIACSVVATALALLLAACNRAPADSREVVRFWAMGYEGEVVARMLPEFERRNPGIKVDLQQLPWTAAQMQVSVKKSKIESVTFFIRLPLLFKSFAVTFGLHNSFPINKKMTSNVTNVKITSRSVFMLARCNDCLKLSKKPKWEVSSI